jgi:hypothetical protein
MPTLSIHRKSRYPHSKHREYVKRVKQKLRRQFGTSRAQFQTYPEKATDLPQVTVKLYHKNYAVHLKIANLSRYSIGFPRFPPPIKLTATI